VIRFGKEMADRFFPIPVAFDLVPILVQPAAAVAVGQLIGIIVLEGFLGHE
jgi:hypothetical protein